MQNYISIKYSFVDKKTRVDYLITFCLRSKLSKIGFFLFRKAFIFEQLLVRKLRAKGRKVVERYEAERSLVDSGHFSPICLVDGFNLVVKTGCFFA